ncbi:MAG: hypothetical protein EOP06_08985 [Proteobacteria bacterium]|nr:MAG: hypothetical protein EOP06_08985 [Pseudomonadota bacterium]
MELELSNTGNANSRSGDSDLNAEQVEQAHYKPVAVPFSFFDKIAERFSFYLENQHLLYRPVIWLSVIMNVISFVSMIRIYVTFGVGLDAIFMNGSLALYPLLTLPLAIVIALAAKRELSSGKPNGITLFAMMLVLEVANWNLLTVIAGCYAIGNSSARNEWREKAPKWYQKICAEIQTS